MNPASSWATGAMAFASAGVVLTFCVIYVFIRYRDTPVVRASGRELSAVLLTGILLCYSVTFILVQKPTDLICGLQRIGVSLSFTIVYAAILTKSNRSVHLDPHSNMHILSYSLLLIPDRSRHLDGHC